MLKRTIRLGADPFPPYQFINEHGEADGLDYHKVVEIFHKSGYETEVVIDEWNVVEGQFLAGKLDALFQVQKNPVREKKFQFSPLLRNAVTEVLTADKYLQIQSYHEIYEKDLKLGVLKGYSYGESLDGLPHKCKKSYGNSEELLMGIAEGKVDLGVFDQGVKHYLLEKKDIGILYPIKKLEFLRPLYIMCQPEMELF